MNGANIPAQYHGPIKDANASFENTLCALTCRISALQSIAKTLSEEISPMVAELKQNRYFTTIKRSFYRTRLVSFEKMRSQKWSKYYGDIDPADLTSISVETRARKIDLIPEVNAIINLKLKSSEAIIKMIRSASEDIPWCKEELAAVWFHLKSRFQPAFTSDIDFMKEITASKRFFFEISIVIS